MLLPILIKLEAPSDTRLQKEKIPGQKGGPGAPGPTPKSALVFVQACSWSWVAAKSWVTEEWSYFMELVTI